MMDGRGMFSSSSELGKNGGSSEHVNANLCSQDSDNFFHYTRKH